jgi:hypothetical protein
MADYKSSTKRTNANAIKTHKGNTTLSNKNYFFSTDSAPALNVLTVMPKHLPTPWSTFLLEKLTGL